MSPYASRQSTGKSDKSTPFCPYTGTRLRASQSGVAGVSSLLDMLPTISRAHLTRSSDPRRRVPPADDCYSRAVKFSTSPPMRPSFPNRNCQPGFVVENGQTSGAHDGKSNTICPMPLHAALISTRTACAKSVCVCTYNVSIWGKKVCCSQSCQKQSLKGTREIIYTDALTQRLKSMVGTTKSFLPRAVQRGAH